MFFYILFRMDVGINHVYGIGVMVYFTGLLWYYRLAYFIIGFVVF